MEIWIAGAGPWTVEDYLRRFCFRALSHSRINEDLNDAQREALRTAAARHQEPMSILRTGARALEDFEDVELLESREQVNVRDGLVDGAEGEAWKIVGLREAVIAAVGQSREKVFSTTRIGDIKNASREVTVATAAEVAGNIRRLPAFDERDRLAERLEARGAAMADDLRALHGHEERWTAQRGELQRVMDAQRVEIVRTYGSLLTVLPKTFVETLFPRPRRARPEAGAPPTPPTE